MSDSVGSVSVEVVPDARGWSEKLRAQLRDQKVQVKADADVSAAETKLDEVSRDRTANVKVNVDKNPIEQGAKSLDSFIGKLGLLPALAIAGSAALVPLAGALGGVAAALSAPLLIAAGGATVFGFLAGFAVKDTEKQLKSIDGLRKKVDSAKTSLANAERSAGKNAATSTAVANAQIKVNQAVKNYQAALHNLGPEQQKFANAQNSLKDTFEKFIGGKAGTALLAPLVQGMDLLSKILPKTTPLITSVSHAIGGLLNDLDRAASGPGFDRFMKMFARQAGTDITGFGHVIGNIASGLGGLFGVLDRRVGHSMVDELVKLSGAFSDWANSKAGRRDVRDFLDYFHKVGPQVADTVGSLARGIGHLVSALAPLGPPMLHVIKGIADAISGIPTPVLTALLAGAAGTIAFQKVGGFKAAPGVLRAGQNVLSAVTGGLIPGAGGGKGVVPVYVTNAGFGDGSGGGSKGALGKAAGFLEKHPIIAGGLGVTAAATGVAASVYAIGKLNHWASDPGKANQQSPNSVGGMDSAHWKQYDQARIHDMYPDMTPQIKATTTGLNALAARAGAASRALDLIGPHANGSLRQAVHAVEVLNTSPSGLDGLRARAAGASRSLDLIGQRGAASAGRAAHAVEALNAKIAEIHDRKFTIIAQTASAISALERLQAMRIADKSFNIYAHYNASEQAVGPGGGMGQNPHGSGGGGASGGGMSGRTPVHIHLDNSGRASFTGFLDQHYQDNSGADAMFQRMRAGH